MLALFKMFGYEVDSLGKKIIDALQKDQIKITFPWQQSESKPKYIKLSDELYY